jgi:hypothetical protein
MSSTFETALKNTLANETSCTENGAIGYKTSGKALLDLNFSVSSLRKADKETIEKKFSDAFFENPMYAVKWLFFARDVRGGMGERRIFRICFAWLANTRPEVVKKLIPLVAEYGRFDDLIYSGLEGELWDVVVDYIDNQITEDYKNASVGKPTSLLAKWLPSCNTSSSETRTLAKKIYTALKLSEKEYRKMLSKIRANLKVIEVDASAKNWSKIDYEKVPSLANLKYKNAFLRNDETRRREYLAKLDKGEAKINSSVAFPCDIVHNYVSKNTDSFGWHYGCNNIQIDSALEVMWKSLPDFVKANDRSTSTIVVADDSGSMTASASGNMTILTVAQSLAIYFSEKLTGPYKNKCITFSNRPQYLDFSNCKSLIDKIKVMYSHSEVANTNIEAVYDLILQTAIDNNLKQEDIPANVLLVSDMEFDSMVDFNGCGSRYSYNVNYSAKQCALFEQIKKRYEAAGYIMPRTVFWNVGSRTGTVPIQEHKTGTALVSGYSPAIAKMVFSAKTDPYEVLLETLDIERYKVIEETIKNIV